MTTVDMDLKFVSVSAICNGTVIDHIPGGEALTILRLLNLNKTHHKMLLGIQLPSQLMGKKDIIKVEEWELKQDYANPLALFAPQATISIIRDYKVAEKFQVQIPKQLIGISPCPNKRCISRHEPMKTHFHIQPSKNETMLQCHYCDTVFSLSLLEVVHDSY